MLRQPHILIVDDDGFIRDAVERIAKLLGYKVTKAKNGQEALEYAYEQIFDLIISDLFMPVMDGNELITHIKELPEYKNIPFIFLSGSTEHGTWLKNLNAGADDFITKPFDKKILALKLKSHIKRYFLRKELLKSNMEYNINLREGLVLYCTDKNSKFRLNNEQIIAHVKNINSSKSLFENIENLNIWILIVDYDSLSEYDIEKIKISSNLEFSIILLAKQTDNLDIPIDKGAGNIVFKSLPEKLFYHQINALIAREIEVKSKYINAIRLAAENSPVRLNRKTEINYNSYKIDIIHEPFEHIPGGDFYEILSTPDDHLKVIVIGDVMGKKWGAWFFVNAYLAYIRSTIHFLINSSGADELSASVFMQHLNKQISLDLQVAEVFTTLSIIVIHKNETLNISVAGAMKPLLYKNKAHSVTSLNITGMLLGISESSTYHQLELEMEPNDKLLFYSDGYTETLNSETNEMLSVKSIEDVFGKLGKHENLKTLDIEEKLIEKYHIQHFDDDRSMLLITKL